MGGPHIYLLSGFAYFDLQVVSLLIHLVDEGINLPAGILGRTRWKEKVEKRRRAGVMSRKMKWVRSR